MGIRFNTNTWRAPLQLIDCWLPQHPSPALTSPKPTPRLLQRFARAGWLNKAPKKIGATTVDTRFSNDVVRHRTNDRAPETTRWNTTQRTSASHRADGRFALSGRIDQVCAELERLAAIEQRMLQ